MRKSDVADRIASRLFDRALMKRGNREVVSEEHQRSIALMRFLSQVAEELGVGDHVYVVGGAVRDFVIDKPIKDIDVVIDAFTLGGEQDSDWFANELAARIPVHTSLQTNQYGVAILTVSESWTFQGEEMQGEVIEIANARREEYGGEGGKGYKPHLVENAPIEEDIERRELTFNALLWQLSQLAEGPEKAEIIDLTGCGLDDLEEGIMRCPSDPDKTFSDDPTRMIRVVKYHIRYGFRIDPIVSDAIRRNAQKLKKAPQNAISDILINDVLNMRQSESTLEVLKELGLLKVVRKMLAEDDAFRQTMVNWARKDARILFLFDMMDMGLPLGARIGFLDDAQMDRLRFVALEIGDDEASRFVDLLKQPGRKMDTKALIQEFGLQGREIRQLMEVARDVLLKRPSLRNSPNSFTQAVSDAFRRKNRIAKTSRMQKVWHVTDASTANIILREGFMGSWGDCGFGVYLWTDPMMVKSYVRKGGWDGSLTDPVIIEVEAPMSELQRCEVHSEWENAQKYDYVVWYEMETEDYDERWEPKRRIV